MLLALLGAGNNTRGGTISEYFLSLRISLLSPRLEPSQRRIENLELGRRKKGGGLLQDLLIHRFLPL